MKLCWKETGRHSGVMCEGSPYTSFYSEYNLETHVSVYIINMFIVQQHIYFLTEFSNDGITSH